MVAGLPIVEQADLRAILLEFRDTPFPEAIGAALEFALPELDLAGMGAGAGQFEEAIADAARAAKEARPALNVLGISGSVLRRRAEGYPLGA